MKDKNASFRELLFATAALPFFLVAAFLLEWGDHGFKAACKEILEFFKVGIK